MIDFKPIQVIPNTDQAENISLQDTDTIPIQLESKKVRGNAKEQDFPVITEGNFWRHVITQKNGVEEDKFVLDYPKYEKFLGEAGFYQMVTQHKDKADQYDFVQVTERVVKPADIRKIKADLLQWTRTNEITEIRGALMRGASRYFSKDTLTCLPNKVIKFKKDTATSCSLFFHNCFVEISLDDKGDAQIKQRPYSELDGHIWASQVIDRDFQWDDTFMEGDFARFVKLAVNKPSAEHYEVKLSEDGRSDTKVFNENLYNKIYKTPEGGFQDEDGNLPAALQKLLSVMSGLGYMMHGHKSMSFAKLFGLFDAKYTRDFDSMGRSGKSLVFKAISHVVPTVFIDGKEVNFSKEKETFHSVNRATRVIVFNDVKPNFDFTNLFHKITEGIECKRLYQDPIVLTYDESPKFGLTGNFALKGSDDSSLDRQFIGELEDFFNARHKPVHFFARDFWSEAWTEQDWNRFYSFMIRCVAVWLENKFIEFPDLNYHYKQLAQTIRPEFIDFMEAEDNGTRMIQYGTKYELKELFNLYRQQNPDADKLTQHTFTKNLKMYCKHFNILINPHIKDGRDRNKGIDYVTLYTADEWAKRG